MGRLELSTDQRSGASNAYQEQIRHKPQFAGSLAYSKDGWGGNHNFKLGFEAQRDRKQFGSFQPGNIYYRDRNGAPVEVDIWNTPNTNINDADALGIYLQDSWSVSRRLTLNIGARYDSYKLGWPAQGFTPAQSAYFDPVQVPATDVVSFHNVSPRVGFAWDLTGKGKTVLKGFLGQYFYNPSADVADRENPVGRAQKRYTFRDLNGNKLLDGPSELVDANPATPALDPLQTLGGAGFVKVDRGIEQPYGLEVSTHLEHELFPSLSVRTSYVFKGTRNEWAEVDLTRVNAYTVPFTFQDPGPDNMRGNADDQTIQLFDRPSGVGSNRVYTNPGNVGLPAYNGDYHTVEFAINRRLKDRWMFLTSFEHTWAKDFRATTSGIGNLAVARQGTVFNWQPNQRRFGRQSSTYWNYKLLGRYEFPWQIAAAASYKLQSGYNWGRNASVALPNAGSETILMERINANRSPNVHILDVRLEKALKLGKTHKVTVMVDCFNALNSDVVTNFRITTGPAFQQLIALLDPRIFRFGVRYDF